MRHVSRFVAEDLAWYDNPKWRLCAFFCLFLHVPYLNVGCMRPQHHAWLVLDKKGVLHVACGMVFRHIERIEVVPLALEKWPVRERKTHRIEDLIRFANERRYGM